MPSPCPKCHRLVEDEEVCCAEVRYAWRCANCFKFDTGTAIPYGRCFLCGGELRLIPERDLGDAMRFHAIRDAVRFELESFHFYQAARERAETSGPGMVLERLYEAGLDHLHHLQENYHAHVERDMVEFVSHEENVLLDWPFRGLCVMPDQGAADLYRLALEVEQRARDHFRQLAAEFPEGLEHELCCELAAEEDEHIAELETELEQLA